MQPTALSVVRATEQVIDADFYDVMAVAVWAPSQLATSYSSDLRSRLPAPFAMLPIGCRSRMGSLSASAIGFTSRCSDPGSTDLRRDLNSSTSSSPFATLVSADEAVAQPEFIAHLRADVPPSVGPQRFERQGRSVGEDAVVRDEWDPQPDGGCGDPAAGHGAEAEFGDRLEGYERRSTGGRRCSRPGPTPPLAAPSIVSGHTPVKPCPATRPIFDCSALLPGSRWRSLSASHQ